jgi:transcriptional regulator with XRE-family HTH domain
LDVGERLQAIRKLKGLSQRELAKRAGVTNSTISMIEKNSVSPSISSLRKVLGGIPMSMVEFFSEELQPENTTQIVYKANELIDISDGAVTMKLVGKAHPSRAIAFLNEIYPPGADTGEEMLWSKAAWNWWLAWKLSCSRLATATISKAPNRTGFAIPMMYRHA